MDTEQANQIHTFSRQWNFSQANVANDISAIQDSFSGAAVYKADKTEDISGADFFIIKDGEKQSVQVKRRARGVSKYFKNNQQDICCELIHFDENGDTRPGWSLDFDHSATWLFYLFDKADGYSYKFPMQEFQQLVAQNWQSWLNRFPTKSIQNVNSRGLHFQTRCCFVPVREFAGIAEQIGNGHE